MDSAHFLTTSRRPLRAFTHALCIGLTVIVGGWFATSQADAAPVEAESVSAGSEFTCAVISGAAKCWGRNDFGQIGDGTVATSTTEGHALVPRQVTGLSSGVTAVSAGEDFACAIVNEAAKCWGKNEGGQLGNGSNSESATPVQVTGLTSDVTAISAGYGHACAVVKGSAKCWGSQATFFGALGNGVDANSDGNYDDSNVPVQVSGLTSNVTAISASLATSCAVQSGAAKCWGSQRYGQLGNGIDSSLGGMTSSPIPVSVTGLTTGVTQLSSGYEYTCAVVSASAKCWGDNDWGQLGTGGTSTASTAITPTDLTTGIEDIAASTLHTCAVVTGAAKCWGRNYRGQLGDGSQSSTYEPGDVIGLVSGVTDVSTGHSHSCAIKDGFVWCWGSDWYGAVGDGLGMYERDVLEPVQVVDTIPPPTEEPDGPIILISSPAMNGTLTQGSPIVFNVDGDYPITSVTCSLDGQAPVPCTSPWTPPGLTLGQHSVDIIARDSQDVVNMNGVTFTVVPSAPPVPAKPMIGKLPKSMKLASSLRIPVTCPTTCSLLITVKIGKKRVKLPAVTVPAGTSSSKPVKVRLSAKVKRQIKAALKAKKKVVLTVAAWNAGGTSVPAVTKLK